MMNPKNYAINGGAANDLGYGLGNQTSDQLSDEEKERRKKKEQSGGDLGGFGDMLFGSAASMLLGKGF